MDDQLPTLTSTEAFRGGLGEAIARARYAGQRTLLTVRGEVSAAVVPVSDLQRLGSPTPAPSTPPATSEAV